MDMRRIVPNETEGSGIGKAPNVVAGMGCFGREIELSRPLQFDFTRQVIEANDKMCAPSRKALDSLTPRQKRWLVSI